MRLRRPTALLLSLAAVALLALPAATSAATSKRPTITRVNPMRLEVGDKLTLRGRNFNASRKRTTVIFRASDGRSAFAKPTSATRTKLVLRVPSAVARIIGTKPTRLRLRVLSGKFGPFTRRRLSPVVVPANYVAPSPVSPGAPGAPGTGTPTTPPKDCTPGDYDGDLLLNALEVTLKTDPCLKDTDGDGIEDGFEYRSAVDLNNDEYQDPNQSLPYPGTRPYPNPLDPGDGNLDYDGDTLSQAVEQSLWRYSTTAATRTLTPLTYSDGLQHSIYELQAGQGDRRFPSLSATNYSKDAEFVAWATAAFYRNVYLNVHNGAKPAGVYGLFDANLDGAESNAERYQLDRDGSGFLNDAERDEDADGLSNGEENTRRMNRAWWIGCYSSDNGAEEKPYYVKYTGTAANNPDSDGDGIRDGADDQDHDDVPNVIELSRIAASGLDDREQGRECRLSKAISASFQGQEPPIYHHSAAYGQVNPFNPCLPDTSSRTCKAYVDFTAPWAPFDDSVNWLALN